MTRLQFLWSNLRSSFWFVPSLIFAASIAAAIGLIELDSGSARPWIEQWPRVFGSGAAGARTMLSTIAGSMMTVVGVTFSMTLVTLALASSQYTPRILRNFMADRVTQVVLGTFAGIFIYCLIVLRTIRGGEEDYVPSLAVFFGVVLAVCGIAILIYFIHHIASAIQSSSIIESVTRETLTSIERQYPKPTDRDKRGRTTVTERAAPLPEHCSAQATSARIGYIQGVDVGALMRIAHRLDAVFVLERGVGDFVVRGAPLVAIALREAASESALGEIESAFNIYRFRTIEQDVGFGIRQVVDIALRALSPGLNDTTTAVMCVDYLSAILADLADRPFPGPQHFCDGKLRVVTRERTFDDLLHAAFDQISSSARGNLSVLGRMLAGLQAAGAATREVERRQNLVDYASRMHEARDSLSTAHERSSFERILDRTRLSLEAAEDDAL
jgi:uncharacterized membrane protein